MEYKFLAESLRPTADAALKYFQLHWAIAASRFKAEEKIHKNVAVLPTFWATTTDGHILCVDAAEVVYRPVLDTLVLDCMSSGLPVKLFVAMPKEANDPYYKQNRSKAQSRGVGILEVDGDGDVQIVQQPLSLSLANVRSINPLDFPKAYRPPVTKAHELFRQGSPENACHEIAGRIEAHSRLIAQKTAANGLWTSPQGINFDMHSWRNLLDLLIRNSGSIRTSYPNLTVDLLSRIVGIVPHRNQVSHVIRSTVALVKRDRELRTRYENMCDILRDFTAATR